MKEFPKINENERKVLIPLAESYIPDEWSAYAFRGLSSVTNLEIKQVRRACRSLAKKGLAEYARGLVDGDGMMAGSGYHATELGAALINPCGLCGSRAIYAYTIDDRGLSEWDKGFIRENSIEIKECGDHYKKTPWPQPKLIQP